MHLQPAVPSAAATDHRMPRSNAGDVLDGDVFLVVGSTQTSSSTLPPQQASRHVNSVPSLRSEVGSTIQNRDHANRADDGGLSSPCSYPDPTR